MMSEWQFLAPGVALLWAGVSLGGSLIATPAKFKAPSLTRSTALEVGRAQFLWVGIGEGVLCALMIAAMFVTGTPNWLVLLAPVALFAIQRVLVMPTLDARTVRVIAGEDVGGSSLHVIYIALEAGKFIALVTAGCLGLAGLALGAG